MDGSQLNQTYVSINNFTLEETHRAFIIFVRSKQFLRAQLTENYVNEAVHIPQREIESRFFPYPKYDCNRELQKLIDSNHLSKSEIINPKTCHKIFLYTAMKPGKVDLFMIKPSYISCNSVIIRMIEHLKQISIEQDNIFIPAYFKAFLNLRDEFIHLFITVDKFSGRVHTPVTRLKSELRSQLLLLGQPTVGIDIVTMQPLLLGKVLQQALGKNEYSNWMESGEDIYSLLQARTGLHTREQGKKRFFEILFSKANIKLADVFGNSDWINWINWYKTINEPRNPHNTLKPHSNLAWLLQTTEVKLMHRIWGNLINADLPFLTVHDEIIVRQSDIKDAESIVRSVLDKEFKYYRLNLKI